MLTDWVFLIILPVMAVGILLGAVLTLWKYRPPVIPHHPVRCNSKQFTVVAETVLLTISSLRKECRGQPLALSRIERRLNRTLEQHLKLKPQSLHCVVDVILHGELYYIKVMDFYTTEGTITVPIPAEWVKEGIDDVQHAQYVE